MGYIQLVDQSPDPPHVSPISFCRVLFYKTDKEAYGLHSAPSDINHFDFTSSVLKNTASGKPETVTSTGRYMLLLTGQKFLASFCLQNLFKSCLFQTWF